MPASCLYIRGIDLPTAENPWIMALLANIYFQLPVGCVCILQFAT
jgi:hypothetical protein